MVFKKLHLFSNQLEAQKKFFENTLGFNIDQYQDDSFVVQVGKSQLIFEKNKIGGSYRNEDNSKGHYHYCFLIPRNKLVEAKEWMERKVNLIASEEGQVVYNFESWNAASIYFYDADGNVVEFIARYDLDNNSTQPFDQHQIISVNEIGMPASDVKGVNEKLSNKLGTQFWKGDLERFGTNGDQDGLFLLVNPEIKKTWFPTEIKVSKIPFKAIVESNGDSYAVTYDGGKVESLQINSQL